MTNVNDKIKNYELFANYYSYQRQNEVYAGYALLDLPTAVKAAKAVLGEKEYYKSITIVLNGSDVEIVTR